MKTTAQGRVRGASDTAAASEGLAAKASLPALLERIKQSVVTDDLLHPAIDVLEAYDRENNSELLKTLQVYLDNDCNAQKCGRILFLHRNSLVYRIRRIQEITGCDLADPEERCYLRLSLLLR